MKVALLLGAWAAISLGAWWQFELRYALPVGKPSQIKNARGLILRSTVGNIEISDPETITFLDFTNPDCPCSQFFRDDIGRMEREYSPRRVRFVEVVESGEPIKAPATGSVSQVQDQKGLVARSLGVSATPAAVILDAHGSVEFAGSYNRARFCDDPSSQFARLALESVVNARTPQITRTPFYGCAVPPG